jgi:hypothetical protein
MRREKSLVTVLVLAAAFAAVLCPARDAGAQTPGGAATQDYARDARWPRSSCAPGTVVEFVDRQWGVVPD